MIEMEDKKNKRKTSAEQKKACLQPDGDKATAENHLKFVSKHHK